MFLVRGILTVSNAATRLNKMHSYCIDNRKTVLIEGQSMTEVVSSGAGEREELDIACIGVFVCVWILLKG